MFNRKHSYKLHACFSCPFVQVTSLEGLAILSTNFDLTCAGISGELQSVILLGSSLWVHMGFLQGGLYDDDTRGRIDDGTRFICLVLLGRL